LGDLLGKPICAHSDYAESWEICDHGADQSVVAEGPYRGRRLDSLVREFPHELFGRHEDLGQFPLLIKFLDAHDRLSVQVHPNDDEACRYMPGERGKTEAWVILATEPQSCIYAGLKAGVDEAALRAAIATGSVEECLNRVQVVPGDCIFIPAGAVHAIGEGILLAEVQQSSDITFRLFDWDRVGPDGAPRPLHIDQALASIDFQLGPLSKATPVAIREVDHPVEELVNCRYFTIRRHTIAETMTMPDERRCRILIVLGGLLSCESRDGSQELAVGETMLLPADSLPVRLDPETPSVVLEVFWD